MVSTAINVGSMFGASRTIINIIQSAYQDINEKHEFFSSNGDSFLVDLYPSDKMEEYCCAVINKLKHSDPNNPIYLYVVIDSKDGRNIVGVIASIDESLSLNVMTLC